MVCGALSSGGAGGVDRVRGKGHTSSSCKHSLYVRYAAALPWRAAQDNPRAGESGGKGMKGNADVIQERK